MAKIKEEQLKKVTEQQQALTNLLARIGVIEIEKLQSWRILWPTLRVKLKN